jgi:methanogenic corrinoid protein MtbC1
MVGNNTLGRYLTALLDGDRKASRSVIEEAMQTGIPANSVYADIIWPIMEEIELLFRSDRITPVQEHLATRINRTIVDQLQNKLPRRPRKNKKIVVCCGPAELPELGAQVMADLFESDGWDVRFLGGGLTNDDVLAFIHGYAPDILLIYGTCPKQAPDVRRLIDTIRQVDAWPKLRIMVAGGLFSRAEGLWEHMGADLFAEDAVKALQVASASSPDDAGTHYRTLRRAKKRRQKVALA